jgi:hypothetical protein
MSDEPEWFSPTSGRVVGTLGLFVAALIVGLALTNLGEGYAWPLAFAGCFGGVLVWSALLRPRLALTPSTLVLRNMFETVHVPLAAIEQLAVRQVLAVRVGDRRFVSPAVGKSLRKIVKGAPGDGPHRTPEQLLAASYADFVEARVRQRCDDARAREGVRRGSAEQRARGADVRREPAWLEIALLSVSALGFVVAGLW